MKLPFSFLFAALVLALAGELLVVEHLPGIGWLLLSLLAIGLVEFLRVRLEREATAWSGALWLAPLAFSWAVVWQDSDVVRDPSGDGPPGRTGCRYGLPEEALH